MREAADRPITAYTDVLPTAGGAVRVHPVKRTFGRALRLAVVVRRRAAGRVALSDLGCPGASRSSVGAQSGDSGAKSDSDDTHCYPLHVPPARPECAMASIDVRLPDGRNQRSSAADGCRTSAHTQDAEDEARPVSDANVGSRWDADAVPLVPALAMLPLAPLATKARRGDGTMFAFESLHWTIDASRVDDRSLPTFARVLAALLVIWRRYARAGFPLDGVVDGPVSELLGVSADEIPDWEKARAAADTGAGGWQRRKVWRDLAYLRDARFRAAPGCRARVLGEEIQLLTHVEMLGGITDLVEQPLRSSRWRVRLSPAIAAALRDAHLPNGQAGTASKRRRRTPPSVHWALVCELREGARRGKRREVANGAALPLYYWLAGRRSTGPIDERIGTRPASEDVADHDLVVTTFDCFVGDVYRGIGGTAASISPSTAWEALRAAHAALHRSRVLAENPDPWSDAGDTDTPTGNSVDRAPGSWTPAWFTYVLTPARATGERALVEWLARSYGVWANVTAGYLSDAYGAEILTQLLAAATVGILAEPERTLGRQIAGIAKKQRQDGAGGRIDDSGRRFIPREGQLGALGGRVLRELARLAKQRQERLRRVADADQRLRELEKRYSRRGRQPWVVQGLVSAHLNRAFGLVPNIPRRRKVQ